MISYVNSENDLLLDMEKHISYKWYGKSTLEINLQNWFYGIKLKLNISFSTLDDGDIQPLIVLFNHHKQTANMLTVLMLMYHSLEV